MKLDTRWERDLSPDEIEILNEPLNRLELLLTKCKDSYQELQKYERYLYNRRLFEYHSISFINGQAKPYSEHVGTQGKDYLEVLAISDEKKIKPVCNQLILDIMHIATLIGDISRMLSLLKFPSTFDYQLNTIPQVLKLIEKSFIHPISKEEILLSIDTLNFNGTVVELFSFDLENTFSITTEIKRLTEYWPDFGYLSFAEMS